MYFCIFIFCAPKFSAPGESSPFATGSDSSFLHSADDIGMNVPYLDVRSVTFCKLDTVLITMATPLQAWTGLEGSRKLRLPDLKTIGTRRW